jgi:hypothetical protein
LVPARPRTLVAQLAADTLLDALDHRLANLLTQKYLHAKSSHPLYLHAFPALDRIARELKCRKQNVSDSLNRLEARGHIAIIRRQGRGQTNAIALRFIEVVAPSPGGTTVPAAPNPSLIDNDAEAQIMETVDCSEDITPELDEIDSGEMIEPPPGGAIELRPSPIAIADGTRRAAPPPLPTKEQLAADEADRVEAIKRQNEIDRLVANQARTTSHTFSYNPCAWPEAPAQGSSLPDVSPAMPTHDHHWYGKK